PAIHSQVLPCAKRSDGANRNLPSRPRGLLRCQEDLENVPPPPRRHAQLLASLNRGDEILELLRKRVQSLNFYLVVRTVAVDGHPVRVGVEPQETISARNLNLALVDAARLVARVH